MARQSDTYIGQRIGIRLWLHAVEGTSEEARARSAKRDSVWRMTAGTALMHDQDTGLPDVDVYERVWMTEALGEIEAHEMLLEEAGLPLTAPEDFDASSLLESMSSEAAAPAG